MSKTARTLAAGIAAAALALTGCAGAPADAATVGGVRIADDTVRQTAQSLTEVVGLESSAALRQATYDLLLGEAARQISESTRTPVTDTEKQAVVDQYPAAAAVAATPGGEAWGDAVTTAFVLQDKLGVDTYVEELGQLDITVNPRYGEWDATRGVFTDASLSRPHDPSVLRG